MWSRHPLVGLIFLVGLAGLGCASPPDVADEGEAPVIGGRDEAGHGAVGFLEHATIDGRSTVQCTATLIAPDVAVTAAHCVETTVATGSERYFFGVGRHEAPRQRVSVSAVLIHPAHTAEQVTGSYFHPETRHADVAVLRLAEPIRNIAPVRLDATADGAETIYVGYGRTSPTAAKGPRKSVRVDIFEEDAPGGLIHTRAVGGGLCRGDSGGALLDARTGALLGVLEGSYFDDGGASECQTGNSTTFVAVDAPAVRTFLERAARCRVAGYDGPADFVEACDTTRIEHVQALTRDGHARQVETWLNERAPGAAATCTGSATYAKVRKTAAGAASATQPSRVCFTDFACSSPAAAGRSFAGDIDGFPGTLRTSAGRDGALSLSGTYAGACVRD